MSAASFARRYAEIDIALTPSLPRTKRPPFKGWNRPENAITDPQGAFEYWSRNPGHGMAALLAPSKLVSIDVDHTDFTRDVLRNEGIDLDAIAAPRIVGNPLKFRLTFRAPAEALRHRTVSWPQKDDARRSFAVFEFRAGNVADQLPPTIHPSGRLYKWAVPPSNGIFPPLQQALLDLWRDWPAFEQRAKAICPWWTPTPPAPPRARPRPATAPSVIDAFNAAHDVVAILESNGYVRQGKRFASPDTSHAPGLVLLDTGKIFCHHEGDILGGGKPRDAFDCWCLLEHGGNVTAAVRTAAKLLGIEQRTAA